MGEAILIVLEQVGQVVMHADAMIMSWDRCSELVVHFNSPDGKDDGRFTEAFCVDANSLLAQGQFLEN